MIKTLQSRHLFTLQLKLGAARTYLIGNVPTGRRMTVPVDGGTFEGDRLRGTVLPDGADWVRFRSDGVMEIDVRTTLKTHDDALIYLSYRGYLHATPENMQKFLRSEPQAYENLYARTSLVFETAAPQYAWLNKVVAVANGTTNGDGPLYEVFEIT